MQKGMRKMEEKMFQKKDNLNQGQKDFLDEYIESIDLMGYIISR